MRSRLISSIAVAIATAIVVIGGFVPIVEVSYAVPIPQPKVTVYVLNEPYDAEGYEMHRRRVPVFEYLFFRPSPAPEVSETPTPPLLPPPERAPAVLSTAGYVACEQLGYGFDHPGGWEFYTNVDGDICDPALERDGYYCVHFPDRSIKKVVVFSREPRSPDGLQVAVTIEFMVTSVTDPESFKDEFRQHLAASGLQILSADALSLDDIEAYDILSGTPSWKLRRVVFFANEMAYVFTYSSQEELYRAYEETFGKIIGSFRIQ